MARDGGGDGARSRGRLDVSLGRGGLVGAAVGSGGGGVLHRVLGVQRVGEVDVEVVVRAVSGHARHRGEGLVLRNACGTKRRQLSGTGAAEEEGSMGTEASLRYQKARLAVTLEELERLRGALGTHRVSTSLGGCANRRRTSNPKSSRAAPGPRLTVSSGPACRNSRSAAELQQLHLEMRGRMVETYDAFRDGGDDVRPAAHGLLRSTAKGSQTSQESACQKWAAYPPSKLLP